MEEFKEDLCLADEERSLNFPEALFYQFGNENNFLIQLKEEIEKNIKNRMIDKISNDVILKNIIGPDYINLNDQDKKKLAERVEEIKGQIQKDKLDKKRQGEYEKLSNGALLGEARDARRAGYSSVEELRRRMDNEIEDED